MRVRSLDLRARPTRTADSVQLLGSHPIDFHRLRSPGGRPLEHWHIARVHWLRSLDPDEAEALRRGCSVREYARGQTIFAPTAEPDAIYLLEHGLVRIFRVSPGGEQLTLYFVHPGQVFGELSVIGDKSRESFAQATRRSVVWRMDRDALLRMMRASPRAAFEITKQVAGKLKRIESRVADLVFRPLRVRLARTVLLLAEDFGEPEGPWVSIELPLTQAELGTLVGATRQSVSECFRELAAARILTRERGRLLVLQPEALKRIAAGASS